MRITGADVGITRVEHEPLRPVAIGVLGAEHPAQQVAQRVVPAQGQQQLGRALADIAGAPATAGELFQPTRHQVVHQGVVRQPGQPVGQLLQALTRLARRAGQGPVQRRRLGTTAQHRVGACLTARISGRHQRTLQAQRQLLHGRRLQAQPGQLAAAAVQEQRLVAAHGQRSAAGLGLQAQATGGEALRHGTAGRRLQQQLHRLRAAAVAFAEAQRRGRQAVVMAVGMVEGQVQGHQQGQRQAVQHLQAQTHGRCLRCGVGHHLQPVRASLVDPGGAGRREAPGRGQIEQLPAAADIGKHPQTQRPEDPQVATLGGQAAVGACMALGQAGMEHARHPHRAGQGLLVGCPVAAAAQQVAMRAQHQQILGAADHMGHVAAAGIVATALEEAQRLALGAGLGMAPAAAEPGLQQGLIGRGTGPQRRVGKQAAGVVGRRAARRQVRQGGWRQRLRQGQHPGQPVQVGQAAGGRVVGFQPAEEATLHAHAGGQAEGGLLQRHQRLLMLQAPVGQWLVQQAVALAGTRGLAQHLQCVGGKGIGPAQAAAEQPGRATVHRLVLARGQQHTVRRMLQRLVVQVLADIGLVQAQRIPGCQRHVLQVDQVQPQRRRAGVGQLHMPEPGICLRRQHQFQRVAHTAPQALLPHPAAMGLLAPRRRRAQQRHRAEAAIGLVAAQPEVGQAGLQRAGREQVDGESTALQALQATMGLQPRLQAGPQPAAGLGQHPHGGGSGGRRHGGWGASAGAAGRRRRGRGGRCAPPRRGKSKM